MKAYIKRLSLLTFLATISFISLLYFFQKLTYCPTQRSEIKTRTLGIEAQKESSGFPVRLIIPAIKVNADIQYLGVNPKGEMEVPSNTIDVGWFSFGPRPGEKGSAVIAGHFDGGNNKAGVFVNLKMLKEGDKLYIEDDKGMTIPFIIRKSHSYNPGYVDEVFSRNDNAYLNLITCDGVWNEAEKSYSERLVVFAEIIH